MSDKKTLLKENTIRRFMKLASISPLAENFIDNKYETPIEEKEEAEVEEGMYGAALREPGEDEDLSEPPVGEPEGLEPGMEEPGLEEPGLEEPGEAVEATVTVPETDVEALRTAKDVIDQILSASEGGEEPGLEEPEMGEEPPPGPPTDDEDPMMEDAEASPEDEEGLYEYKEEDLVKEVSRRVAKRLKQRSHKEKIAEELAERIFRRLKKKN